MNRKTSPNKIRMIFVMVLSLAVLVFSNKTIILAATPDILTGSANSVTRNSANLNGTVNDNGGKVIASVGFEYGLDTSYGTTSNGLHEFNSLDSTFGDSGSMTVVSDIAIDSSNNIYVVDNVENKVKKFNSAGVFQSEFGSTGSGDGQFASPTSIVLDNSGNIYVSDTGNARVEKFNSAGTFQLSFTGGSFMSPGDLAINSSGDVYVVDSGVDKVQKFNSAGVFQSEFGSTGSGDGQFTMGTYGIGVDSLDNIYVLDGGGSRIEKFDPSGIYINQVATFGSSHDVDVDAYDNIYFFRDGFSGSVSVYDTGLNLLYGLLGTSFGDTYNGMGVNSNTETLYMSDITADYIEIYKKDKILSSLTGLSCDTTYHFRAFAVNSDGTSYGNDDTFTTDACEPPVIETKPASKISKTSAVLNGIEPDYGSAESTVRGFEYGQTTSYGNNINANETSLNLTSATNIFSSVSDGLDRDSSGNFYLHSIDQSVDIYDSSMNFIKTFGYGVLTGANQLESCTSSCQSGIPGSGDGQLGGNGTGIAVDQTTSDIYVTDTVNSRVEKFDSSGNYISKFSVGCQPKDIILFGSPLSEIIVLCPDTVKKFDTSGSLIASVGSSGSGYNQLNNAYAMNMDTTGTENIFIADTDNNRIQLLKRSTMTLSTLNINFSAPSGWTDTLTAPSGVAIGYKGNLFISNNLSTIIMATFESDVNGVLTYKYSSSFDYNTLWALGIDFFDDGGDYISKIESDGLEKIFFSAVNKSSPLASMSPFLTKEIKNLTCNTTYHYRAFATNPDGTSYGNDLTFNTLTCGSSSSGGGGGPLPVYGCTDSGALNYNSLANSDDGSCTYPSGYFGCTDPTADNFNPSATAEDGSCTYGGPTPVLGCTNPLATNYNVSATQDDGSCDLPSGGGTTYGCTDSGALNFDGGAMVDNGSCSYTVPPGTPPTVPTTTPPITPTIIGTIINVVSNLPEPVKTAVKVIAVAGVAIPLIELLAEKGFLANLISIPIRLWNLLPTLLGFKRKKRPWGTVYDSVTKQPLDPVYVRLSDDSGKEISTFITDLDGRYGFGVPRGIYFMTANKQSYIFPSEKLKGQSHDELYDNLYFGEKFETTSEDEIVNKNIPMDAINFNWNEFEKAKNKKLMKFYSNSELFLARISKIIFVAGFLSSIVLTLINPMIFNYIILGLYIVIFLLSLFGIKPRRVGFVKERATGYPLSFGIISVFSALLGTEVGHAIIGKTGRYYLLVPKGRYFIKLKRKTGENSYEEIFTSDSFKVSKGYIDKVLKV